MSDLKVAMKPVKKKSLSLKISDSIYGYIRMNGLQPGDKLPSERDMSMMLETSRNSVREALRILEDRGIIEVRTGIGAFLKNPYGDKSTFSIRLHDCTIDEIQELQNTLDNRAVTNATLRATDEEKEKMVSIATEMVRLANDNIYSHVLDNDFHTAVYVSGRNTAIHQMITKIREERYIRQEKAEAENDQVWLKTVPHHLWLAEAIRDGNVEEAMRVIDEINEYGFEVMRKKN